MESPELYIPDEALVEAIVDARAAAYIPSPALVARILSGNRRRRPRFRLPPQSLFRPAPLELRLSGRQAAGIAITVLGLSPAALAAATVVHIAILGVTGWLLGHPATSIGARLQPPVARESVEERLTYIDVDAMKRAVARVAVTARRPGATITFPVPAKAPPRQEPRREPGRGGEGFVGERVPVELLRRAFSAEFVMEGQGGRFTAGAREQLIRISTALTRFPEARIIIVGERAADGTDMRRAIVLDVESILRFLGERQVNRERIQLEFTGSPVPDCALDDVACRLARRMVRVRLQEGTGSP